MTSPTGNPRGRPPGAKNKRTAEIEAKALATARAIEAALPGSFEGDAHALLMMVYKDVTQPIELRLEAAGKAIRYEKPALASVDHTSLGKSIKPEISDKPMTAEEWEASCIKH